MRMRHQFIFIVMLGAVLACATGPALADGDVTMTVIPSGGDVVKTVVQNITVPANTDKVAKAPHKAPAADHDNAADRQTQQQLAEAAAEHQTGQTQQLVQQQALEAQIASAKAKAAPPAPPPPPKPPR